VQSSVITTITTVYHMALMIICHPCSASVARVNIIHSDSSSLFFQLSNEPNYLEGTLWW